MRLASSDDDGLTEFDIPSRGTTLLLSPPEGGYYLPRSWFNLDQLFVPIIPENEGEPIQHGWISMEGNKWQELPTPEGIRGYGCDTGAAWSSEGDVLAITGLEYGEACNLSPGLTIADLSSNSAQILVAPVISSGEEDESTLIAGAHTPAWSPDGSWIAFGLDQDASEPLNFPTRLYRVHPDGSNLTPLTSNSQGKAAHPVWAPDGSLYYGLSGAGADLDGLYHYLPDENTHTVLIPGSGILPLSISPDGEFLLFEQDQVLKIWQFSLQEIIAEITGEGDSSPTFVGWILLENNE
jgi:dipeptidyl aminopeptidase/acylaminoacyl peptidase